MDVERSVSMLLTFEDGKEVDEQTDLVSWVLSRETMEKALT